MSPLVVGGPQRVSRRQLLHSTPDFFFFSFKAQSFNTDNLPLVKLWVCRSFSWPKLPETFRFQANGIGPNDPAQMNPHLKFVFQFHMMVVFKSPSSLRVSPTSPRNAHRFPLRERISSTKSSKRVVLLTVTKNHF